MTNSFETLVLVGRELRFVTSEEQRRRIWLRLPYCARLAVWFTSEIRARIDVELADYAQQADGRVRDDLESVAWTLGKSVQAADTAEDVETIRALECFLIEALWAADGAGAEPITDGGTRRAHDSTAKAP
jgi:hypothetical protein